jgi:hypothetical protein
MSATNDFDERARRKLEEREHAFDESAWQALRPELDAMRDQKRRRRFVLWFIVLAILGAAGWLLSPKGSVELIVERSPENERASAMVPTQDTATSPSSPSTATASNVLPATPSPAASTPAPQPPAEPQSATEERPKRTLAQQGARTNERKPLTKNKATARTTIPPAPKKTPDSGSEDTTNSDDPRDRTMDVASTSAKDSAEVTAKAEEITVGTPLPSTATEAVTATVPADTASHTPATTRDTLQYVIAVDSTFIADSAIAAVPPQPRSRLELSVWGGPFNTSTRYTGDRTMDWASNITKAGSMAFGAELMRQGEHFGLGAGLHYTSYVEQLNAESLKDELRTTVTTYQINGIDTTVLVVNGTVWINGQQYYMTQMLDTTIYVLVGTDSEVVSTNVRRNALARSNRTSYLEIPLLFDAHIRRGHWGFALRGGPTLGIVQGRRGVLPTSSGYTDLSDEAFSELVLGYTLQGHIRYHLSEAWSLGIGPALRGQFSNTLQSDQLQRRANAAGAVITLGYRLP